MLEPVTSRIIIRPFDITEHDVSFAAAKRAGIEIVGKEMTREQQAVDRGTVVAVGPTAFIDFGTDNPLKDGDEIVYARHSGKEVEDIYTKEKFVVINDEDVVAIFRKE